MFKTAFHILLYVHYYAFVNVYLMFCFHFSVQNKKKIIIISLQNTETARKKWFCVHKWIYIWRFCSSLLSHSLWYDLTCSSFISQRNIFIIFCLWVNGDEHERSTVCKWSSIWKVCVSPHLSFCVKFSYSWSFVFNRN